MNGKDLSDTIDLSKRDFSLVLVSPKEKLLEWLRTFVKLKRLEKYRVYVPEENTVLIIPNMDRFSEPGWLRQFLDEMKPKLLFAELGRFHASPEDLGYPLTKETFDEFFNIALRDSASIRFMSDFKNL
jgi:hypothetical protein